MIQRPTLPPRFALDRLVDDVAAAPTTRTEEVAVDRFGNRRCTVALFPVERCAAS